MTKIFLDDKKRSWLDVLALPETLVRSLEGIMQEKPKDLEDTVIVYNKKSQEYVDKKIFRKYKSYLTVPAFDPSTKKSYMFSSSRSAEKRFVPLPDETKGLLKFLVSNLGRNFNQSVFNWYDKGDDYIEMHSDCESKLVKGSPIVVVTITEAGKNDARELLFKARDDYNEANTLESISVSLENGSVVVMGGDCQKAFRHGLLPADTDFQGSFIKKIDIILDTYYNKGISKK